MKTISAAFLAHLASGALTVAILMKVVRTDGTLTAFTNHDVAIPFDGQTYRHDNGIIPSDMANKSGLAVDNMEITTPYDDNGFGRLDLAAGRYDAARVTFYIVNYTDPDNQNMILRAGVIGKIVLLDHKCTIEIRGLSSFLQNEIGEIYTPGCRADFGDARCKAPKNYYTEYGVVRDFDGRNVIVAEIEERYVDPTNYEDVTSDWFADGLLTFDRTVPGRFVNNVTAYSGLGALADVEFLNDTIVDVYGNTFLGFSVDDAILIENCHESANDGQTTITGINGNKNVLTTAKSFTAEDNSWATISVVGKQLNHNFAREVQQYTWGVWPDLGAGNFAQFKLVLPVPFDIQVGDIFSVVAGCNKSVDFCGDKFNNILNLRGEPYINEVIKE